MKKLTEISEIIRTYIFMDGLSISEICRLTRISAPTFYRKLQNPETFTIGDLEKIQKALGRKVYSVPTLTIKEREDL